MIFLIYSHTTKVGFSNNPGLPEHSDYFTLKEFRPVLEKLGKVMIVENPETEVDPIYMECKARGEQCVFLSFSPPHKTALDLACPTISVLTWEFDTIPNEIWDNDPRNDWRYCFGKLGWAITQSEFAVKAIKAAMGDDFPVVSISAPVWDRFEQVRQTIPHMTTLAKTRLMTNGVIFDSRTTSLSVYAPNWSASSPEAPQTSQETKEMMVAGEIPIDIEGVVYTTTFCPYDGRKNWFDMFFSFCWAFRDVEDATLIMELTHRDNSLAMETFKKCLYQLTPFKCRIIAIQGPLSDHNYEQLAAVTTYCLNTSHGEGQCLPLMEFMSDGIPAVDPRHTSMGDYVDERVAFLDNASAQPTCWPQDNVRMAYRTKCYRIDCESMVNALLESYRVAKENPERYVSMSRAANARLKQHCSRAIVQEKLRDFISVDRRIFRSFAASTEI